jgi:phosphoesterase RecJ-like protein
MNGMYKKIYKKIKEYETIVIARHIGVDPDAMASQLALRDIIKNNFPDKNVYAVGAGSVKFNYIGQLDKKYEKNNLEEVLLIVVDTPDKKRIDIDNLDSYKEIIKIDHHPFIETFGDLEKIDENKSSASEMIVDFVKEVKLKMTKEDAEKLFIGIISDTERFMFDNSKPETLITVADLMKDYDLNISELYKKLYSRPLNEVKFYGYLIDNIVVTENGLGYIKISKDVISKYKIDSASAGNMINQFNFIDELIAWATISEDVRNNCIRVSMRSRGPIINKTAEKYHGGGHKLAAGARVKSFEEADLLMKELDELCKNYKQKSGDKDENR